jgi:hypothetical protein
MVQSVHRSMPSSTPTPLTIRRAARKIHARLVAREDFVDPEELLGILIRETGADRDQLAETATKVLATFETLDGEALTGDDHRVGPTPAHDMAEIAVALADGIRRACGREVIVLCSHRFPLEEAPGWCRDRGGLTLVVDRRERHPAHPD